MGKGGVWKSCSFSFIAYEEEEEEEKIYVIYSCLKENEASVYFSLWKAWRTFWGLTVSQTMVSLSNLPVPSLSHVSFLHCHLPVSDSPIISFLSLSWINVSLRQFSVPSHLLLMKRKGWWTVIMHLSVSLGMGGLEKLRLFLCDSNFSPLYVVSI